jgi:precorrin-6x reductase
MAGERHPPAVSKGTLQAELAHVLPHRPGARGPFALDDERALMERIDCDVLVSKNSGSQTTEHQLQAARERGTPVLVLKRPELPAIEREFASGEALLAGLAEKGLAGLVGAPHSVGWKTTAGLFHRSLRQ